MPHDYVTWSFVDELDRSAIWDRVAEALVALGWEPGEREGGLSSFRHDRSRDLDIWIWPERGPPGAVVASCSERVKEGAGLPVVLEALTAIHGALGAPRTMWGWELGETIPFDPVAEQARLREGRLEGVYWLDIVRKSLMTRARRHLLRERVRQEGGSVFHPLPNGDALYRGRVLDLP